MDVVRSLDGRTVATVTDLLRAYAATAPEARVALGLWRGQRDASAVIGGGRAVLLSPRAARFSGEGRHPVFDAGKDFLGGWTDERVGLAWDWPAAPAGEYDVAILVAAPGGEAGSSYRVAIGAQRLEGRVPATGGWESFAARAVGVASIPQAGALAVELRAESKPAGAVMNLRGLVLTRR
jgi:hypothetical protein